MLLLAYFIVYFLLVFVIRSILLWKKTGINPFTFDKKDNAHSFNGKIFKLISAIELTVIIIYAFKSEWYKFLLPFWYLENAIAQKIGWSFLIISLIWVWIAQSQMKKSWRIGIDKKNKSELITEGLFTISRNPIFLGIMIANAGLFLIIPNAFTLLIVSLSTVSMNTQVRLEEEFLEREFGDTYIDYSKKVRRWF
jgi:protein-S-isoprenylcysteine O-methyltransferase Ste14